MALPSEVKVVGVGSSPTQGTVTLTKVVRHSRPRGLKGMRRNIVLFLDEIAEFGPAALEALRQPMEAGEVSIARAGGSRTYPCRFTLVAAMNPCPCGFRGAGGCRCTDAAVRRYQAKLSGPILDRIDLRVRMGRLSPEEQLAPAITGESGELRARVTAARCLQAARFAGTGVAFNAAIPPDRIWDLCRFSPTGLCRYEGVVMGGGHSTRAVHRLAKVARTVADLDGAEEIEPPHVDEAVRHMADGLPEA
jgi:magnesium chelatase family protein